MLSRLTCVGSTLPALRRCVLLNSRVMAPVPCFSTATSTEAAPASPRAFAVDEKKPHDHSLHFKLERYFAVAMLPLIPAAYFIHGPAMDYALALALSLHIHWGFKAVVEDYARPIVVGEKFAKIAPKLVYLVSAVLLASLLHFNYNVVGLTKAFELVFAL